MSMVETLNRIHKKDPDVLSALIDVRVRCNQELANDTTVQVESKHNKFKVGILGILNGIASDNKEGIIYAVYDNDGVLTHFMQAS